MIESFLLFIINFIISFAIFGGWLLLVKQFEIWLVFFISIILSIIMTTFLIFFKVERRTSPFKQNQEEKP